MSSSAREITDRRKENLKASGKGHNSMFDPGLKPSGPESTGLNVNMEDITASPVLRWASLAGGAALAGYGIYGLTKDLKRGERRSYWSCGIMSLLGAGLIYRGATGIFGENDEMGYDDVGGMQTSASVIPHLEGVKVEASIVINRSPDELYHFWRNFENLPRIMSHLKGVETHGDTLSHWVAKAPLGLDVEWDAEVYIEKVGELISWRSTEDSQIDNAGSVRFEAAGSGGTNVIVMLKYDPPAGQLGAAIAKLFGEDPQSMVEEDLRKFKRAVESGELGDLTAETAGVGSMGSRGRSSNGKTAGIGTNGSSNGSMNGSSKGRSNGSSNGSANGSSKGFGA